MQAFSDRMLKKSKPRMHTDAHGSKAHSLFVIRVHSWLNSCFPHRLLAAFLLAATLGAQTADYVIGARYVVTMDPQRRVIENGAVVIQGERIAAIGPGAEIAKRFRAKQTVNLPNAIVTPGLINTHTHAPMALFRGIADDLRLQDWLEKHIFPAEAKYVTADFVRWGTRLACIEMLLSGTTTYTDMYYFEEVIAETTKECGMRGVLGQTIIGFPVPDAKTPADGLRRTEQFIRKFRGDSLITPAVAPHALYTNSDDTLKQSRALANKYNVPLLIHLSETRRENEETQAKRRMSPARVFDSLGIWNGRSLAAHAVWLDDADLKILKARNVGVAHCPSSNMKLASGVARVPAMLAAGLNVGLGPDGPAGSNNDFNLFEEMDLAAKLAKVTTGDPQALPATAAFEMATIGGARALGIDDQTGSLEPGKRADLMAVAVDAPHAVPMFNVYSHLVYALKGADVQHVWVNGRQVVRNRKVLTIDAGPVLDYARKAVRPAVIE
jgi:5-methylthioadenosine/S-adenosylhomocysteine deaminase